MPERAQRTPGESSTYELSSGAKDVEVRRASDWLDAACRDQGVPPTQVDRLVLCLSEVLANVFEHGKPTQPVTLRLEVGTNPHGGEASVTVADACRAFDPLSVSMRMRPASLDEAPTSGMGLDIIRFCSDVLRYRHEGGRNHLTFGARWKAE